LWKCWLDGKKKITNRDNPAVKQAGAQMTGKMVPSGCGMEVWYDMLLLHLWHAQLKEENVVDPGLGGSVAKAAGGGSDAENDDCGYDEDEDGGGFNGDGMRGHQLGGPRGAGGGGSGSSSGGGSGGGSGGSGGAKPKGMAKATAASEVVLRGGAQPVLLQPNKVSSAAAQKVMIAGEYRPTRTANPVGFWITEVFGGAHAYWDGKYFYSSTDGAQLPAPDWFKVGLPPTPLVGELYCESAPGHEKWGRGHVKHCLEHCMGIIRDPSAGRCIKTNSKTSPYHNNYY